MTFFLIVPSVIIIGVFLVHGVFNRLGLRIHYIALIVCAVLSVASDAGAAILSPAPDKFYFMRLGGFILASALAGTLTNYFLVKREHKEQEEFSEQVREAYEESKDEDEIRHDELKAELEKTLLVEEVEKPVVKVESKADTKIEPKKIIDSEKKSEDKEIVAAEKVEKVEVVEKVESKVEPPKIEPPKKVKQAKVESEKILAVTKEGKVVKKFEPEKVTKSEKIVKPAEKPKENPAEKVEPVKIPAKVNLSESEETLDNLLDSAYEEKAQGHTWQAIAIYKKALEKYRNDEYAPFVAIDLGNIYKEQAMYAKAIKIYEDALELPAVKRNFSTMANFKKNIIYLKSVQSVLLRHQALSTPFSKISKVYLQEIESEFQAAQLKV